MQKKTYKTKIIMLIVGILLLACTITGAIVLAKYITNERTSTGLVTTKNFYFTSNLLDGEEHTFAPDTTSVTFTLGNYEDDLRYSEMDIEYTVTVDDAAVTVTNEKGTLVKGSIQNAEITISGLKNGKTYTITAVGKGGYQKTLKATIVVSDKESKLYYNINNSNSEYILLTVWNEGDAEGAVTIIYTGIPDNTNPNMEDWTTNASKELTIGPHESKEFRFFGGTVTVSGANEKALN